MKRCGRIDFLWFEWFQFGYRRRDEAVEISEPALPVAVGGSEVEQREPDDGPSSQGDAQSIVFRQQHQQRATHVARRFESGRRIFADDGRRPAVRTSHPVFITAHSALSRRPGRSRRAGHDHLVAGPSSANAAAAAAATPKGCCCWHDGLPDDVGRPTVGSTSPPPADSRKHRSPRDERLTSFGQRIERRTATLRRGKSSTQRSFIIISYRLWMISIHFESESAYICMWDWREFINWSTAGTWLFPKWRQRSRAPHEEKCETSRFFLLCRDEKV